MTGQSGNRDSHGAADTLSTSWDALVSGDPTSDDRPSDTLLDMARRLHAIDTTPALPPARHDRIWREILATHAMRVGAHEHSANGHPSANGRAAHPIVAQPNPSPRRWRPSWRPTWMLAQLATAALLLVTLGLGYLTLGWRLAVTDTPVTIPAVIEAPRLAPDPVGVETLLDVVIPADYAPPWDVAWAGVSNHTIPAGNTSTWETPALRVEHVVKGAYSVRANGPMLIVRGETGTPEAVPAGAEIIMAPGDTMIAPPTTTSDYANPGVNPAELVSWFMGEGSSRALAKPQSWVASHPDIRHWLSSRGGPVRLRLWQVTLAPDATFEPPPDALTFPVTLPTSTGGYLYAETSSSGLHNLAPNPIIVHVITAESTGMGTLMP